MDPAHKVSDHEHDRDRVFHQSGLGVPRQCRQIHRHVQAYLAVLPDAAPGLTPEQIISAVQSHLPQDLFPGGEKAGWWGKAVQLDLEAKGVIRRSTKPVRLYKVRP